MANNPQSVIDSYLANIQKSFFVNLIVNIFFISYSGLRTFERLHHPKNIKAATTIKIIHSDDNENCQNDSAKLYELFLNQNDGMKV